VSSAAASSGHAGAGASQPAGLTAGFQAALIACSIFLATAAIIATRVAGSRRQLAAVPQPAADPGSVPKAA
jgi:hypothetical protein